MTTERELAALAAALIGDQSQLNPAEKRLIGARKVSAAQVQSLRALIAAGGDPLGDLFAQIRAPEARRKQGATYTPAPIVTAMIAWAARQDAAPARVVDAGAGSGRYLIAAARQFPKAKLVGVELDPLAALLLRANAAVLGFAKRLAVILGDYRELSLPRVKGRTLFIGNPPYVRHHDISEGWKEWFATTAAAHGFTASKLAGLHVHFFLKTRVIARPGDFGAFITAAEWLDVNYGSVMRQMLADGLGGMSLHLIDPKALPFADAMTTGAITCFHVGNRAADFTMRAVDNMADLAALETGRRVAWGDMTQARKWSPLIHSAPARRPAGHIELGELFRVQRGQVTGCNAVWVENPAAPALPDRFLLPAVTRARELLAVSHTLRDGETLRRVVDLPVDLSGLSAGERRAVDAFLRWARNCEAHQSYIARHRRAWWSVGYKTPAPILSTYMARRAPHFVRNAAGARHINIAHGLYPRQPMTAQTLDLIAKILRQTVTTDGGRTYAGGLVKFEPKELERLTIPRLESLHDFADEMDRRTAYRRRCDGAREFPA